MTGRRKLTLSRGPFSTQLSHKEGSNLCVGFPNLSLSYKNLILSMNEFIYSYQLQVSNFSLHHGRQEGTSFQHVLVFFSFCQTSGRKGEGLSNRIMFTLHTPTSTLIHRPKDSKQTPSCYPEWSSKLTTLSDKDCEVAR